MSRQKILSGNEAICLDKLRQIHDLIGNSIEEIERPAAESYPVEDILKEIIGDTKDCIQEIEKYIKP